MIFAMILIACCTALRAAPPATGPSTAPTTQRTAQAIMADIQTAGMAISSAFKSPDVLTDAAKRAEAAPKILPALKRMWELTDELAGTDTGKVIVPQMRAQMLPLLALFGDEQTNARVEAMTKSVDPKEAVMAKSAVLLSQWWKASTDAASQGKVLDQATELAKANPESTELMQALMAMSQLGAASPELRERTTTVISQNMKGAQADQIKKELDEEKKLHALENKPLEIKGTRNDGTTFSTADWKGKVVLVDFWATWCGPCREELPRVKKAYADFHDRGLEVLGVSCDRSGDDLKKFLAENPDMPWPQLFDQKTAGWHPLATEYGINGIPTMFLIDKKGVVRTVEARENFEALIPKMLAE